MSLALAFGAIGIGNPVVRIACIGTKFSPPNRTDDVIITSLHGLVISTLPGDGKAPG
jgi:hypothetical protein